jgi:hypothetical protein
MSSKRDLQIATAKLYVEKLYSTQKSQIAPDFIEKNADKYMKLVKTAPPLLQKFFGSLITQTIDNYDGSVESRYTVVWLGRNLEKVYTGKEFINLVPQCWEDEYDFYLMCELMTKGF